jgi:hypothetical protein
LVVNSALASQIERNGTSYDFLGVVDHADYESEIFFSSDLPAGPLCLTGMSHCEYMRYHTTYGMILVDLKLSQI